MTSTLVEPVLIEIKVWMARRRLNQSELAARVGEGQPWVSKRLNGTVNLAVEDLVRIAEALDVPAGTFLQPVTTESRPNRYNASRAGKSRARSATTTQAAA